MCTLGSQSNQSSLSEQLVASFEATARRNRSQLIVLSRRLTLPNKMTTPKEEIQTRLANGVDAEKITALINVAFKGAENFFVEGDRIDLKSVLESLEKGEFVIAESQG